MGGVRGEKKWREDGTSTPEGQLRNGRGSYLWRGPLTVKGSTGKGRRPLGDKGELC